MQAGFEEAGLRLRLVQFTELGDTRAGKVALLVI